jgi:thiol-disulfide isomerase/thioredoxin
MRERSQPSAKTWLDEPEDISDAVHLLRRIGRKKRGNIMRIRKPLGLLLLTLLSALTAAAARDAAPPFMARTLTGETFTNDSLKGQVVLLQFWTTWCPYCRRDQPLLDKIARDFSGDGLVVLAVNAAESGETVKTYLEKHPRSCNVVLAKDTNLLGAFSLKSVPSYVLIDRDGNIAGTDEDIRGNLGIRGLLGRAGLGGPSAHSAPGSDQGSAVSRAANPRSATLIEIPKGLSEPPPRSLLPTVFVLRNGERVEAEHYTIMGGSVRFTTHGNERTIPLAELDQKATIAANRERGIDLKFPTNQNEIFLGF